MVSRKEMSELAQYNNGIPQSNVWTNTVQQWYPAKKCLNERSTTMVSHKVTSEQAQYNNGIPQSNVWTSTVQQWYPTK